MVLCSDARAWGCLDTLHTPRTPGYFRVCVTNTEWRSFSYDGCTLQDDKAIHAYRDYVFKLREADKAIAKRNREGAAGKSRVRGSLHGMDYTLLSPSPAHLHANIANAQGRAPAGITFRGVPPSISI